MSLIIIFFIIALSLNLGLAQQYSSNSNNNVNLNCVDAGECVQCSVNELEAEYCRETGKKMKILCTSKGHFTTDDFKSCNLTAKDEQFRVIIFQVAMAVIGGLAYWGVQNRKQINMSLFEHRKQRYVLNNYHFCCIR